MSTRRFDHTGFTVADLDRSVAWYSELLGTEPALRRHSTDGYMGEMVGYPGCEMEFAYLPLPGGEGMLERSSTWCRRRPRQAWRPATSATATSASWLPTSTRNSSGGTPRIVSVWRSGADHRRGERGRLGRLSTGSGRASPSNSCSGGRPPRGSGSLMRDALRYNCRVAGGVWRAPGGTESQELISSYRARAEGGRRTMGRLGVNLSAFAPARRSGNA